MGPYYLYTCAGESIIYPLHIKFCENYHAQCNLDVFLYFRFDSSKGQWEVSKPMLTLRSRIGVAAVDGLLYAIGGYDGTSRLQTVECFDPKVVSV